MNKRKWWLLVCGWAWGLAGSVALAQPRLPDAAEVERRNAAAVFVAGREMSLSMLHRACSDLLKGDKPSMDQVTRQWLERNHAELEASDAWLRRYFGYLNSQHPELATSQSELLRRETSRAVIQAVETHFHKEVPTRAACAQAARSYSATPLDFRQLKSASGYEAFGEFADTLQRVRDEPGYSARRPPRQRFDDLVADGARQPSVAWLAAADAAGERGDERARAAIFETLAQQGDAKSAHTLGLAYYRGGGNLPADPKRAYGWFYQAWALGDLDGLNGLGVMINEGVAVPRDPALALAAFALAKAGAGSGPTFERAQNKLAPLLASQPEASLRAVACLSLGAMDARLESLSPYPVPGMRKRALSGPGRRLGELSPDLAPLHAPAACAKQGAGR